MRRTLEKLAHERRQKEEDFAKRIKKIKEDIQNASLSASPDNIGHLFSELEEATKSLSPIPFKRKRPLLPFLSKRTALPSSQQEINQRIIQTLKELQKVFLGNIHLTGQLFSRLLEAFELQNSMMDARDREWDALGSNHVGMIFKSMEWRVDKLASQYEDVKLLMKKFILIRRKLDRLLATLEEKKLPQPEQVREILEPLEDWRYAGFENRFRGHEEEIKKQLEAYLVHFEKGGRVLDLGCGRGEFLELLENKGIKAEGVDLNSQMVDICLDKGLSCQKGDILEKLSEREESTFDGIFSSQVIEHLPPAYLKQMVELCYQKLKPSGILILETINPTSVFALVQIYMLDVSHKTPVHPQALKFLLESAGFRDIKIEYSRPLEQEMLQNLPGADEFSSIMNQNIDHLNKLLYASPNYAAVAKKR